jgi:hypothetical protein
LDAVKAIFVATPRAGRGGRAQAAFAISKRSPVFAAKRRQWYHATPERNNARRRPTARARGARFFPGAGIMHRQCS